MNVQTQHFCKLLDDYFNALVRGGTQTKIDEARIAIVEAYERRSPPTRNAPSGVERYKLDDSAQLVHGHIVDTYGQTDPEMHKIIGVAEVVNRLNDYEMDETDPAFEHDDDDLRDLMNWTAAMNSRRANMDTSIAFLEALQKVEKRLDGWRAAIVQAAEPGDVVFLEAQRKVTIEDMQSIKKTFDEADLGVRIVVLPHDLKIAIQRQPSRMPEPPEDTDGLVKRGI